MSAAGNLWHGTLPRMAVYPISFRKDWVRIFASASSAPSASSANPPKGNGTSDLAENNRRTVGDLADGKGDDAGMETGSTFCANPLKSNDTDGVDVKDANPPSQTGPEKSEHPGWRATL